MSIDWHEPGELTEDDRRLIRLLSRTADMLDDAYLPDDSEQQLAMTLTQDLRAELTARFGPNWEEVLRDKD